MKILCVCERGNSRSVALAWILKDHLHHDALAMGIRAASRETQEMLYTWADLIVVVDALLVGEIPRAYLSKIKVWDVGPDRYFRGFDPNLLNRYARQIMRNGIAGPGLAYSEKDGVTIIHWPTDLAPVSNEGELS